MKARELIEKLQEYPPDTMVLVPSRDLPDYIDADIASVFVHKESENTVSWVNSFGSGRKAFVKAVLIS